MTNEHPAVARFRAEHSRRGGTGDIVILPDSVHTAALAAEALGCEVAAIANSLLFDADGAPMLILTSGGRGADEPVAEGEAMADYLLAQGIPADRVMIENRSRNTEQNLRYSAALLAERGVKGPIAAVTNNFHAFRAAMLMRRLGIAGYSIGAPTARYYWPTAVIREFVAVLRDHIWLNAIMLGLCCLPLLLWLVTAVANLVR